MGGCANSKYAVDEDKMPKKDKKPMSKKGKNKKEEVVVAAADDSTNKVNENLVEDVARSLDENSVEKKLTEAEEAKVEEEKIPPKADKEDIEFIDKEEAEKQREREAAAAAASANNNNETSSSSTSHSKSVENDDTKKEITTYQTTVVKHTQKEGDELFQHLKDEAFRTLQNLLKQQVPNSPTHTTRTTTASTEQTTNTTNTDSASNDDGDDDIVQQIKTQVVNSIGKSRQEQIGCIIECGADLVKENKVKSMNELRSLLEKQFPDSDTEKNSELIGKVIASTTGFLTAKGTEAGVLLSNILANASSGLQGVMNETEKTTVKVTRTVTEQIMSGGQLKEVTKVITSNEPMRAFTTSGSTNFQDVLKNLNMDTSIFQQQQSPSKIIKTGTTTTTTSNLTSEKYETVNKEDLNEAVVVVDDEVTKKQAEQVVTSAVNAAVERIIDEEKNIEHEEKEEEETSSHTRTTKTSNHELNSHSSSQQQQTSSSENGFITTNGHQIFDDLTEEISEENIKIEEESSMKMSSTKIVLNGGSCLEQVQSEFFKHGKHAAEELVKKINETSNESSTITTTNTVINEAASNLSA